MTYRTIHSNTVHYGWNRDLAPAATVAPGDEVVLEVRDASDGQIIPSSTSADVARLDLSRANPVTGPIVIEGAAPGDALLVDLLDFATTGWGWTGIIPGFGLLAEDFPDPFLRISRYSATALEFVPGVYVPVMPFPGTIGVAPAAPGVHSVIPPRRVGGNMDCRDLVRGARLRLPVEVPGALLSIGDTHAAQGDGEVCGTAVESAMTVRIRVGVEKGRAPPSPQLEVPAGGSRAPSATGYYVTTGIANDLMRAAQDSIRAMIDYLVGEYGFDPPLAYCLCSVAVDLRISEIVDAPTWVVSAHLPRSIFGT